MFADPVRIRQVVSNLLSNAIKFTDQGTVEVSVMPAGRQADLWDVTVRDTGTGMDADQLARLFESFVQVDSEVQRASMGTGLGLAIARDLARLMQGDITVRSQPGVGSSFRFRFTAAEVDASLLDVSDQPIVTDGLLASLEGMRALLVDDTKTNRIVARTFLSRAGMDVTEAENGQIALDCLARDHFDVVLMDIRMPVMDGPTALGHIRALQSSKATVPVIALTANAEKEHRDHYLSIGMTGYLPKPLRREDLLAEIGRVLSESSAIAAE